MDFLTSFQVKKEIEEEETQPNRNGVMDFLTSFQVKKETVENEEETQANRDEGTDVFTSIQVKEEMILDDEDTILKSDEGTNVFTSVEVKKEKLLEDEDTLLACDGGLDAFKNIEIKEEDVQEKANVETKDKPTPSFFPFKDFKTGQSLKEIVENDKKKNNPLSESTLPTILLEKNKVEKNVGNRKNKVIVFKRKRKAQLSDSGLDASTTVIEDKLEKRDSKKPVEIRHDLDKPEQVLRDLNKPEVNSDDDVDEEEENIIAWFEATYGESSVSEIEDEESHSVHKNMKELPKLMRKVSKAKEETSLPKKTSIDVDISTSSTRSVSSTKRARYQSEVIKQEDNSVSKTEFDSASPSRDLEKHSSSTNYVSDIVSSPCINLINCTSPTNSTLSIVSSPSRDSKELIDFSLSSIDSKLGISLTNSVSAIISSPSGDLKKCSCSLNSVTDIVSSPSLHLKKCTSSTNSVSTSSSGCRDLKNHSSASRTRTSPFKDLKKHTRSNRPVIRIASHYRDSKNPSSATSSSCASDSKKHTRSNHPVSQTDSSCSRGSKKHTSSRNASSSTASDLKNLSSAASSSSASGSKKHTRSNHPVSQTDPSCSRGSKKHTSSRNANSSTASDLKNLSSATRSSSVSDSKKHTRSNHPLPQTDPSPSRGPKKHASSKNPSSSIASDLKSPSSATSSSCASDSKKRTRSNHPVPQTDLSRSSGLKKQNSSKNPLSTTSSSCDSDSVKHAVSNHPASKTVSSSSSDSKEHTSSKNLSSSAASGFKNSISTTKTSCTSDSEKLTGPLNHVSRTDSSFTRDSKKFNSLKNPLPTTSSSCASDSDKCTISNHPSSLIDSSRTIEKPNNSNKTLPTTRSSCVCDSVKCSHSNIPASHSGSLPSKDEKKPTNLNNILSASNSTTTSESNKVTISNIPESRTSSSRPFESKKPTASALVKPEILTPKPVKKAPNSVMIKRRARFRRRKMNAKQRCEEIMLRRASEASTYDLSENSYGFENSWTPTLTDSLARTCSMDSFGTSEFRESIAPTGYHKDLMKSRRPALLPTPIARDLLPSSHYRDWYDTSGYRESVPPTGYRDFMESRNCRDSLSTTHSRLPAYESEVPTKKRRKNRNRHRVRVRSVVRSRIHQLLNDAGIDDHRELLRTIIDMQRHIRQDVRTTLMPLAIECNQQQKTNTANIPPLMSQEISPGFSQLVSKQNDFPKNGPEEHCLLKQDNNGLDKRNFNQHSNKSNEFPSKHSKESAPNQQKDFLLNHPNRLTTNHASGKPEVNEFPAKRAEELPPNQANMLSNCTRKFQPGQNVKLPEQPVGLPPNQLNRIPSICAGGFQQTQLPLPDESAPNHLPSNSAGDELFHNLTNQLNFLLDNHSSALPLNFPHGFLPNNPVQFPFIPPNGLPLEHFNPLLPNPVVLPLIRPNELPPNNPSMFELNQFNGFPFRDFNGKPLRDINAVQMGDEMGSQREENGMSTEQSEQDLSEFNDKERENPSLTKNEYTDSTNRKPPDRLFTRLIPTERRASTSSEPIMNEFVPVYATIQSPDNCLDKMSTSYPLNFKLIRISAPERPYEYKITPQPDYYTMDPRFRRIQRMDPRIHRTDPRIEKPDLNSSESGIRESEQTPVNPPPLPSYPPPQIPPPPKENEESSPQHTSKSGNSNIPGSTNKPGNNMPGNNNRPGSNNIPGSNNRPGNSLGSTNKPGISKRQRKRNGAQGNHKRELKNLLHKLEKQAEYNSLLNEQRDPRLRDRCIQPDTPLESLSKERYEYIEKLVDAMSKPFYKVHPSLLDELEGTTRNKTDKIS